MEKILLDGNGVVFIFGYRQICCSPIGPYCDYQEGTGLATKATD